MENNLCLADYHNNAVFRTQVRSSDSTKYFVLEISRNRNETGEISLNRNKPGKFRGIAILNVIAE